VTADGSPLDGVSIAGRWSHATSDFDTGMTTNGSLVVTSDEVRWRGNPLTFVFTLDSVTKPPYTYEGGSISDSITVTQVP